MTGKFSSKGRGIAFAFSIALVSLSLLFAVTVFAQRSDKATVITFNSPVEIPGSNPQVLPAGTYMFKIIDSKSTPHIVQVSDKEESKVYSTIMAIPAHRDAPTRETVITFEERGSTQPQAVQTWFYPNDTNGEEFVYSGTAPQQVAAVTAPAPQTSTTSANTSTANDSTASATATTTNNDTSARSANDNAAGSVNNRTDTETSSTSVATAQTQRTPETSQEAAAPPPQAPQPATSTNSNSSSVSETTNSAQTSTSTSNERAQQTPDNSQTQNNSEARTLPHTASNLPLLFLVGVLSIGAGLTIRRLARG